MSHKSNKHHKGCCQHQEKQRGHHRRDGCRQRHGGSGQQKHGKCCSQEQSCGCEGGHQIKRRFLTKEEKIARLEAYLHDLKTEAQAVQEHIAALKEA